jgi:magnesium-transporting ATPase (P-type)
MATTSHFSFWFAQGIGFGIDHARECLEYIDGIAIFCTVALVVLVGAFQEAEKERKFMALNANASEEQVNVIRDGVQQLISTREVVVGDTVVLSTGDILCADGIVYERNTLSIFEGPLTGESVPISKGQYEFKEKGTWEMPPDEDLKQYFPPAMTLDQMKVSYCRFNARCLDA